MTDDFTTLSNAELDHVSGGAAFPFVHPVDPSAPHGGWRTGQAPISAITLFNNPEFYCKGTTTAKAF
jgi:bacteriocin-like protein